MMRAARYFAVATLAALSPPAVAKNSVAPAATVDAAIKACLPKARNWKPTFDAYYNRATEKVETNVPTTAESSEVENWQFAGFAFRKCLAEQGVPLA